MRTRSEYEISEVEQGSRKLLRFWFRGAGNPHPQTSTRILSRDVNHILRFQTLDTKTEQDVMRAPLNTSGRNAFTRIGGSHLVRHVSKQPTSGRRIREN
jgi:hypothetical protein